MTDSVVAARLAPFGVTIFAEMSALAAEHGAVNLGQGFPNFEGPAFVKEAAARALRDEHNQYARPAGVPALNEAIRDWFAADGAPRPDPDHEITVTAGCTEGIAATMLGLLEPGDEVILFEPFYDSYRACVAMAGATPRFVTLRPPAFRIDPAELRAAFGPRTRAIVVNTPHNPTGRVLDASELGLIAALCREFDVIAIADEVYERLVYDAPHLRLASFEDMWERTISLSSIGKTFSLTGWKIGWAVAPKRLSAAVRAAHQFLTFVVATPLQHAAAAALRAPESYFAELRAGYLAKRDLLVNGLASIGFGVTAPEGTYFVLADHSAFGFPDDRTFCRHLVERLGVATIPPGVFYSRPSDGASLVRFAFCKDEATLREALERLRGLRAR